MSPHPRPASSVATHEGKRSLAGVGTDSTVDAPGAEVTCAVGAHLLHTPVLRGHACCIHLCRGDTSAASFESHGGDIVYVPAIMPLSLQFIGQEVESQRPEISVASDSRVSA